MILFYSGVAQTSNKKRVLVIPPNRFEYVSEFDLEVIAKKMQPPVQMFFYFTKKHC
jgi:hypothetical protein